MTRLLDLGRSDLAPLAGRALVAAVGAAEGRTMVAEVVAGAPATVDGVHGAELVAAFGADLVLLNLVEGALPHGRLPPGGQGWLLPGIGRLPDLRALAHRIGRPVGVVLEPGDVPEPRRASVTTARRLLESGAAMLCLTANPGAGTTAADLVVAAAALRDGLGPEPVLLAGKMHQAGRPEPTTPERLLGLVEAGVDGVLLPVPGTVPGLTREAAADACAAVHGEGALVVGTVGTSQEGAPARLAGPLALLAKEVGVDAHHLGDAGVGGASDPELLYQWSLAVRGRRHTWRRMAWGVRAS